MGAHTEGTSCFVTFEHSGQIWQTPDGKPTDFTARQIVGVAAPEFVWRATMGHPARVVAADYFVAGTGGLEVILLGAFPMTRMIGGRFVPLQGDVAWGLETGDFVHWRGRILKWNS